MQQISVILNDLMFNYVAKDIVLIKLKNKIPNEHLNETPCLLCKKEKVAICRYCFSVSLADTLRELNFPEDSFDGFGYNLLFEEEIHKDKKVFE